MWFRPSDPAFDGAPPSLPLLLGEVRVLADWRRGGRLGRAVPVEAVGQGEPVVVLPGFFATDASTLRLRRTLKAAGYRAHGWAMGRNLGVRHDLVDQMNRRLDRVTGGRDERVTLVGWSLGGLMAREFAKHAPDRVAKVITLGSPFSGDPRANHAWRLYEMVARHPVDETPIPAILSEKPPVPTIAIWSRQDGVIAPASARGAPGERDEAVEVGCGHMGFPTDEGAIRAVLAAMRE